MATTSTASVTADAAAASGASIRAYAAGDGARQTHSHSDRRSKNCRDNAIPVPAVPATTTPEQFVAGTINAGVDFYEREQYDQALMAFAHALAFTKRVDVQWTALAKATAQATSSPSSSSSSSPLQQQAQQQGEEGDDIENDDQYREYEEEVDFDDDNDDDQSMTMVMDIDDGYDHDGGEGADDDNMKSSTNIHHQSNYSSFHNSTSSLDRSTSLLFCDDDDGDEQDEQDDEVGRHGTSERVQVHRQQHGEQQRSAFQRDQGSISEPVVGGSVQPLTTGSNAIGPFQPTFGKSPFFGQCWKEMKETEDSEGLDDLVVFLNPIRVPLNAMPVANTRKTFALIALFNLAVGYHQRAIAAEDTLRKQRHHRVAMRRTTNELEKMEEERLFSLRKALAFYELAYSVQMQEGIDMTLTPTMVIMSNVGQIHQTLGNTDHSAQCFQHLLSTLMFLVEAGEAQDLDDGLFEFDFFFENILKTIYSHSPASAA